MCCLDYPFAPSRVNFLGALNDWGRRNADALSHSRHAGGVWRKFFGDLSRHQKPSSLARDVLVARRFELPTDSPAVAEWRARMATPEAKATYQLRAATSECVNAQARSSHGLLQFRVRGLIKALCVALWVAITHNLLIWIHHLQSVT